MNIYFNGDSNMSGAEVEYKDAIPSHIANFFNTDNCVNDALSGACNDHIYTTTMKYLENNTPDLVVIGWSDTGRMQMFNPDSGKYVQMNGISVGAVPANFQPLHDLLHDKMQIGSTFSIEHAHYWHYRIFEVHNYLKYRNIKHLFFSAFDITTQREPIDTKYHLDWNHSYFEPYQTAYVPWCLNNNYKQQTEGHYHFEPAAQKAWADKLCKHLSNYIL
jgi:hypothetical protein